MLAPARGVVRLGEWLVRSSFDDAFASPGSGSAPARPEDEGEQQADRANGEKDVSDRVQVDALGRGCLVPVREGNFRP